MSKTLSESAAEILKASMSAAKEPASKLPAEIDDLGGQTPTTAPSDIGKKAAADAKEAPKPATKGDAKSAKTKAMEETEADETAEVVAEAEETIETEKADVENVDETNTESEELADKTMNESDKIARGEENSTNEETGEYSEEELAEAKKDMMKDIVAKHRGSMKEDVDALFNGESLSEDFRVKATLIFETAVQSRVGNIIEDVMSENDAILAEAVESIKEEMSSQVDEYLNYVVEQWVEDNQIAIETGLRAELVDDFINGLKNLFNEHYIEIPEEKVDVAEELAARVAALEEAVVTAAAEKASLVEQLNVAKKTEAVRKICEGLTETQIAKMISLAESVEFTTEGDFNSKLAVIRENYFPAKKLTSEVKVIQETSIEEPEEVAQVNGLMAHYVKAITKTAPKA